MCTRTAQVLHLTNSTLQLPGICRPLDHANYELRNRELSWQIVRVRSILPLVFLQNLSNPNLLKLPLAPTSSKILDDTSRATSIALALEAATSKD